MIIIGYPGIGKTSLARKNNRYIDLCTEDFFYKGERPEHWWVFYCNVAERLSKQGYIVFVSSHSAVRTHLASFSHERMLAIFPSLRLRRSWVDKLKKRCDTDKTDATTRAYERASTHYNEDVSALALCGVPKVEIVDMNYDLENLFKDFINKPVF